jgi:transcriptional regulator with XRE-family HTH domain
LFSVYKAELFVDIEDRERLAAFVRLCRGNRSQADLAYELGVGQTTIGEWERGRTPSLENFERIALKLGIPPEQLLAQVYGREYGTSLPLLDQVRAAPDDVKADILRLLAEDYDHGE